MLQLVLDDGGPNLVFWHVNISANSTGKAGFETVGNLLQLGDRAVAGEHHLLVLVVEGVEGVEQFFLRLVLVLKEVDIVYQQHVCGAVLVLEFLLRAVPD